MPTASTYAADTSQRNSAFDRWSFTCLALVMVVVAIAGFAPSIVDSSRRLAPLTPLVAVHGILCFLWLLLFLLQTTLMTSRRADLHRRMGIVAVVLLTLIVPVSYVVTVQMARRGFDLSGDQMIRTDPLFGSIFNFFGVVEFSVLAGSALAFRKHKEIHKRLMLFANISLMGPPITHFLGHFGLLTPVTVLVGLAMFFLSAVARDYISTRRVHPLTATLAIVLFLCQPIQAIVGTTAFWHHFGARLAR
jgi:hypothetical protein